MALALTWWRRVDSNHRSETQQIYSLPPLATRELLRMKFWSWWTDSNPRPADYKSAALPTELHQQIHVLLGFLRPPGLISIWKLVEATGFEPAASWSQTKHSTKLSYASLLGAVLTCPHQTAYPLYRIFFRLSTVFRNFFVVFLQ